MTFAAARVVVGAWASPPRPSPATKPPHRPDPVIPAEAGIQPCPRSGEETPPLPTTLRRRLQQRHLPARRSLGEGRCPPASVVARASRPRPFPRSSHRDPPSRRPGQQAEASSLQYVTHGRRKRRKREGLHSSQTATSIKIISLKTNYLNSPNPGAQRRVIPTRLARFLSSEVVGVTLAIARLREPKPRPPRERRGVAIFALRFFLPGPARFGSTIQVKR